MNARHTVNAMMRLNDSCPDGDDVRSALYKLETGHIDHLLQVMNGDVLDKCIEERHDALFKVLHGLNYYEVSVIQRGKTVSLYVVDSNYGTVNVSFPFVVGKTVATFFYQEKVRVLSSNTIQGLVDDLMQDLLF